MNYTVPMFWYPKDVTYKNAVEYHKYKFYGFDMDFQKEEELRYFILNNCLQKYGDVLFDLRTIANKILNDRMNETGDNMSFSAIAGFISMMFMEALIEDNLDEKLKYLLEEYLYKNKKYYNYKYKGQIIYREMYKSCMCYPEILFYFILENTKSDVLGKPLYLTYGRLRYCKVEFLKPNENGDTLIDCDPEDAKWAAGIYKTPEEKKKLAEERRIINEVFDKLEAEGKTYDEISAVIDKMREEGTL